MNVKIFYENIVTEFPGKLLLAAELLNNSKIKNVTIGHYKQLFFEIIKEQKYTTDNSGDSVVYKDIWAGSEVFIKIFKLLKFKYYALQQEDYLIFNKKFFKNISYNFISNKYFLLVNKFFTLSKYSLKLWNEYSLLQSDKLLATGNPRYEYVKKFFVKDNNNNNNNILLAMPGLIFGINCKSVRIPNIKKLIKKDDFTMNSDYDKLIQYSYNKSLLRFYLKIAKENQKLSFLLRIYPYERPYLKYYLRLIKNIKNLKISSEGTIFDDFQKTYLVITASDNVSLEASIFGIKTYVYARNKILHNYLFGDHLFLKIYPNNIINKKNYDYILNNLDPNYKAENNHLKELYGLNLDSSRLIAREIVMSEDIKYNFFLRIKNTFIYYLLMFFIKKIFFYISIDKKNNYYNLLAFNNFKKKFKYSLTRIFFYLLFYDLKNMRHDVHNVIYKYLLGKNYHETSIKLHNSSSFNIDINYVFSLLKSFNSIDVKKLTLSLNSEKNILVIKKLS